MKKLFVSAALLLSFCTATFAIISISFNAPGDNLSARNAIRNLPEIKLLNTEYDDLIHIRIWPLKYSDVTNSFGPKIERQPNIDSLQDGSVLPLFEHGIAISGLSGANDKSHIDLYNVGDIGYLIVFYGNDGESIGNAALFFRPDNEFVPFLSTNDYSRRLKWDVGKFELLKLWLDKHLPETTNLGVIEVSNSAPSRVAIGSSKICIIKTQILTRPNMSNDWFSMTMMLDTTNSAERINSFSHPSVDHPNQSIGFKMDGKFFRLTPKLIKSNDNLKIEMPSK